MKKLDIDQQLDNISEEIKRRIMLRMGDMLVRDIDITKKIMQRYARKVIRHDFWGKLSIDGTDSYTLRVAAEQKVPQVSIDFLIPGHTKAYDDGPTNYDESPAVTRMIDTIAAEHDDYFWPHKNGCPVCGDDAYVGFATVECCTPSCTNFVYKEGM